MDTTKFAISKLNGTNYLIWATQIEALLKAKGIWKYVCHDGSAFVEATSETTTTAATAKETETMMKEKSVACATIICTIEPEYIPMVAGEDDPRTIWKKLSDANMSKCKASTHTLRNRLLNMTMEPSETVREYVNRICTIERKLSFAGKIVDVSDKKYSLLNGLRNEFEVKKTILMESYDMSFERMVSSLEQTEDQVMKTSGERNVNIQSGSTFITHKGHSRRDCTCYICGKKGHMMKDCFFNPRSRNYKPSMKRTSLVTSNLKKRNLLPHEGGSNNRSGGHECEFTFMVHRRNDIRNKWFLDSCASRHLCNVREYFVSYKSLSKGEHVNAACEGATVDVVGVGNVKVSQMIDGKKMTTLLQDVGYAPRCRTNLVSLTKAQRAGVGIYFEPDTMNFTARYGNRKVMVGEGSTIGITELTNMKGVSNGKPNVTFYTAGENDGMKLAHRRMCHTSVSTIKEMKRTNAVIGMENLMSTKDIGKVCESCVEGKATNQPHKKREKRTTEVLQLMHTDLSGPVNPAGLSGEKHMQLITDDYSGAMWVRCLRTKGEAAEGTRDMVLHAQKVSGKKLITMRPDGAKELTQGRTKEFLDSNGTLIDDVPPYSPQSNGRAERPNRTIFEKARTILSELNMVCKFDDYKKLWPEAVRCVVYVHNRTLTRSSNVNERGKTPYEIVTGTKPDLSNLRVFGTKVKVLKPKSYRKSKVESKTWDGLHVGYNAGGAYRCYIPELGRVFLSKDVTFIEKLYRTEDEEISTMDEQEQGEERETRVPVENRVEEDNTKEISKAKRPPWIARENWDGSTDNDDDYQDIPNEGVGNEDDSQDVQTTRSGRVVKRIERFGESNVAFITAEAMCGNVNDDVPTSAEQAVNTSDSRKWVDAMADEMLSLSSNRVFSVVHKPDERKAIKCRWVFAKKANSNGEIIRHKARLVAKGYSQVKGVDYEEVFSPVVRFDTLRFLLAQVARQDLELYQVDVKTAFLYGQLDNELYMELPTLPEEVIVELLSKEPQLEGGGHMHELIKLCKRIRNGNDSSVLRLWKSLYGLKQASKMWHGRLKDVLANCEFVQSTSDPCLFVWKSKVGRKCYVLVYVDDIIIAGESEMDCTNVVKRLSQQFELSAMDKAHFFLGIKIERDRENRTLSISQHAYVNKLLKRFGLMESASKYPMRTDLELRRATYDEQEAATNLPYRELVGSLMYLACTTRPDIMFAVSRLARYFSFYGHEHWKAARTVAKYVSSTKNMLLSYGSIYEGVVGYTDADWAGDKETRKSTGGFVFTVGGTAFVWNSKRQSIVASSSVESEYIAQARCVKEALWIRKLLKDFEDETPTIEIRADNQGSIALAGSSKNNVATKHIDVAYHLTRDYVEKDVVKITYVPSASMVADGMTKALGTQKIIASRSQYGLVNENEKDTRSSC